MAGFSYIHGCITAAAVAGGCASGYVHSQSMIGRGGICHAGWLCSGYGHGEAEDTLKDTVVKSKVGIRVMDAGKGTAWARVGTEGMLRARASQCDRLGHRV